MALGWLRWRAWAGVDAVAAAAVGVAGVALGDPPSFSRGRRGTWWHRLPLCVAGVALMALDWLRWRAWAGVVVAAAVGVAGVALGDIHLRFTWQAWYSVTSTSTLRGRRGPYGTGLAPVARLGRSAHGGRRGCWRGRHGTWRHPPSFHVAGVVLGDIDFHFAWQAWYLVTSTSTLRGRCGTYGTGLAPVARLGRSGRGGRRGCWRGRCGTWRHPPSSHVAGVVLGDIDFDFAWQAWQLWHWTGSGGALGPEWMRWSPRLWCGRRGTWRHPPSFHLAGVVLGDIDLHFKWQAWHFVISSFVLHGRCGTCHTQLCHTACFATESFTHQFVTHHLSHTTLSHALFHTHYFHTTLSHTIFDTPLCHTPSFTSLCHTPSLAHHLLHSISHTQICHPPSLTHHLSHHFVTHHLWHTIFHITLSHTIFHTPSFTQTPSFTHHLWHTIFHTPLCHPPSLTHHFVTHHLSHTIFDTPCFTPRLWHTIFHIQLCHTQLFTYNLFYFSILHHLLCLSFLPRPATTFVGRRWHVGLSGPLIFELHVKPL